MEWFKSSHSADSAACLEVAVLPDGIAVRDSKDPSGPILTFSLDGWRSFIQATRRGIICRDK